MGYCRRFHLLVDPQKGRMIEWRSAEKETLSMHSWVNTFKYPGCGDRKATLPLLEKYKDVGMGPIDNTKNLRGEFPVISFLTRILRIRSGRCGENRSPSSQPVSPESQGRLKVLMLCVNEIPGFDGGVIVEEE
jgi:hypothetical protein